MKTVIVVVLVSLLGAVLGTMLANWLAMEGRRDGAEYDER